VKWHFSSCSLYVYYSLPLIRFGAQSLELTISQRRFHGAHAAFTHSNPYGPSATSPGRLPLICHINPIDAV